MTEPRLQFPEEMPPGKMAKAALQIGNLCQGCGDKERRRLYGKLNSAFQLWEWSDVAAVLGATRPGPGRTAEAAFAATLTKAKRGRCSGVGRAATWDKLAARHPTAQISPRVARDPLPTRDHS